MSGDKKQKCYLVKKVLIGMIIKLNIRGLVVKRHVITQMSPLEKN
jgi:hypothetical protein